MTTANDSHIEAAKEIDRLIKKHLAEQGEATNDEPPVAAVSASHKLAWAKEADVDIDFVNQRLNTLCQKMSASTEKHWAVPHYRMRVEA